MCVCVEEEEEDDEEEGRRVLLGCPNTDHLMIVEEREKKHTRGDAHFKSVGVIAMANTHTDADLKRVCAGHA